MHIHPASARALARVDRPVHELRRDRSPRLRRSIMVGVLLLTLSRSALAGLGVRGDRRLVARDGRGMRIERTSLPAAARHGGAPLSDGGAVRRRRRLGDARCSRASTPSRRRSAASTIWRESLPIVRDFWLTGTGAGTYSDAMTVYQQIARLGRLDAALGALQQRAFASTCRSPAKAGCCSAFRRSARSRAVAMLGWRAVRADKGEMFWVRVGAGGRPGRPGGAKHLGGGADHAGQRGARRGAGRAAALSARRRGATARPTTMPNRWRRADAREMRADAC